MNGKATNRKKYVKLRKIVNAVLVLWSIYVLVSIVMVIIERNLGFWGIIAYIAVGVFIFIGIPTVVVGALFKDDQKEEKFNERKIKKHLDASNKIRQEYPGACCKNCRRRVYGTGPSTGMPIKYCTGSYLTGSDDDALCSHYMPL